MTASVGALEGGKGVGLMDPVRFPACKTEHTVAFSRVGSCGPREETEKLGQ